MNLKEGEESYESGRGLTILNYNRVWPITGGGPYYLDMNLQYLFKNFENVLLLQGIGINSKSTILGNMNVVFCKQCDQLGKLFKRLSIVYYMLWAFYNAAKRKGVVISVGWNCHIRIWIWYHFPSRLFHLSLSYRCNQKP